MRIGIDGRYAEGNLVGIGNYIKYLSEGLSRLGFDCVIFYSKKPKTKIKNTETVILKTTNRFYFEQVLLPVSLKKNRIDIYHATGNVGVPFFGLTPSVLTVHDLIPLDYKGYFKFSRFPFLSKQIFKFNLYFSCRKAIKIISVSKFVKNDLVNHFGPFISTKTEVIYQGVDLGKIGMLPKSFVGKKYILNNGGLDVRKNVDGLIKAFSLIKSKLPDHNLVITGENFGLECQLKLLTKKLDLQRSVYFVGYVPTGVLRAFIKNADCICYPSLMEGFGLPVLEGFSARVPVVCSNLTSLPEIANNAASLVKPENYKQISIAVVNAIKNKKKARSMVKKGNEVVKNFSWEKTVQGTVQVYNEILNLWNK